MREKVAKGLVGCPATACVLVPCTHDLHTKGVFPQPPFDVAEVLHSNDGKNDVEVKALKLYGNPCTFRINEIVVCVTGQDTIMALSGNEVARSQGGDRIARLAAHLVKQHSVSPVFPAPQGTQLALSRASELEFDVSPDVLITPSQLTPFVKRAGGVLCMNPGRLIKGSNAGTFARLTIHPVVRHIRTVASRKITAGLGMSPNTKKALGIETPEPEVETDVGTTDSFSVDAPSRDRQVIQSQQLANNFESATSGADALVRGIHKWPMLRPLQCRWLRRLTCDSQGRIVVWRFFIVCSSARASRSFAFEASASAWHTHLRAGAG